ECSRCRSLVVQLSSAAGIVATTESAKVSAPFGLKKFLASLFTPMVLRYAVPALGLIVVAAIGFMVLRRNQSSELVTQLSRPERWLCIRQCGKSRLHSSGRGRWGTSENSTSSFCSCTEYAADGVERRS